MSFTFASKDGRSHVHLCSLWLPGQYELISIDLDWSFGRLSHFPIRKAHPCRDSGRDGNFFLQPAANSQPQKPSQLSCERSNLSGWQGLALVYHSGAYGLIVFHWILAHMQAPDSSEFSKAHFSAELFSSIPDLDGQQHAKVRSVCVHSAPNMQQSRSRSSQLNF